MIAESVKTSGASDGAREEAQLDFTVRTAEPAAAPSPTTVKTKLPVLRDLTQDTAFSGSMNSSTPSNLKASSSKHF